MENHETFIKDGPADGVAQVKGNIITTATPERKAEEENGDQEDAQTCAADKPDPAASTPLQQETKVTRRLQVQNKVCKMFHQTVSLKLLQQFVFLKSPLWDLRVLFSVLISMAELLSALTSVVQCL